MFKMNGKEFKSMMEIARELGKSRIRKADFEKYGITEVIKETEATEVIKETEATEVIKETEATEVIKETEATEVIKETEVTEVIKETEATEVIKETEATEVTEVIKETEGFKVFTPEEKKKKEKKERKPKEITQEMLNNSLILREKAGYTTIWEWAVDMKKRSAREVFTLAESLGIIWSRNDVERIDRMHAVQALRENLFPGEKRPRVRKSAWEGVPLAFIIEVAKKNKLENITLHDDDKVTKMLLVKALKKIGIKTPEDANYKKAI